METGKMTQILPLLRDCYFEVHSAVKEHTSIEWNCGVCVFFPSVQGTVIKKKKKLGFSVFPSRYNIIGAIESDEIDHNERVSHYR